MPPQLVTLVAQLQTLAANIASIVNQTTTGTVPNNVSAAYAALTTALTQLNTDISASTFVLATVQNDTVTVQSALTALAAALASPSNP